MELLMINCEINKRLAWLVNLSTHEERQAYAGVVMAYMTIQSSLVDPQPSVDFTFSGDIVAAISFLNHENVHITDADNPGIGPKWDKITTVLDSIPRENTYGWWIPNFDGTHEFSLLMFQSKEFIQGFISGCNSWNIDFRSLIFGLPFHHLDNGDILYYDIQGYDIAQPPDMPTHIPRGPKTEAPTRFFIRN